MRQLRDLQLDVTGLRSEQARPVPVAFIQACVSALVSAGADRFSRFELDQLLHHQTHRVTDQVHSIAGAERVEKFRQSRLI